MKLTRLGSRQRSLVCSVTKIPRSTVQTSPKSQGGKPNHSHSTDDKLVAELPFFDGGKGEEMHAEITKLAC